ncbi:MAG: hypothetical protein MK041_12220, partial [Aquabacterium sp.]|nr:hypothetical protein [Aquabacterium sp.]
MAMAGPASLPGHGKPLRERGAVGKGSICAGGASGCGGDPRRQFACFASIGGYKACDGTVARHTIAELFELRGLLGRERTKHLPLVCTQSGQVGLVCTRVQLGANE